MNDLTLLARAAGIPQGKLIALDAKHDPFALHQPARRRNAEWFTEVWHTFGFGHGVHLRAIHYRLVSVETPLKRPDGRGHYLNTASCWGLLINAARDARYLDLVPESAFTDRKAPPPITYFGAMQPGELWLDDGGLSLATPDPDFPLLPDLEFRGARFGPSALVEIWAEKTTQNDVLEPLARRYGANLITGTGEMSLPTVRNFLDRLRAAGTPGHILYVSDFDPAGRSMPVAVARKVEFALHKSGEALDVTLAPLVLTEEQCARYRLPRTPIKETETRAAKFEERFGEGATELDALEALHPGELARIVAEGLERHLDPDHARRFNAAVQEHRQELADISAAVHQHHADDVDGLRAEYDRLVSEFGAWRDRAETVFGRIADHLAHVEAPEFDPPPMTPRPPAPAPMFDARRPYLDQLAAYHQWQGRAGNA